MEFLKKFHIDVKNENLYVTALTHSSYSNEHHVESYERLEFLGDAVLQIVTSEYLYRTTSLKEGEMSKERASYVCERALATYAKEIGIVPFIRVGHGQLDNINDTIIADVFESVIGAIFLDQGFDIAREFILSIVSPYIASNHEFIEDYKSKLQELVQTGKKSLEYVVTNETGPAHQKEFTIEVRIDGMVYGKGVGKSKKEAEQRAAFDAIGKQGKL